MTNEEIKKMAAALQQVAVLAEAKKKKLDKVDKDELDGDHDDRDDKDIDNDGDVDGSDEYLHKKRKAISKDVKEEREECPKCEGEGCDHCDDKGYHEVDEAALDEAPRRKGAPKIKPDFLKVQRAKDAEHNAAMGRTKTGRKKPVRTMTSTQKSLASMRREAVEPLDEVSNAVKDTLGGIDLAIRDWEKRWKNKSAGNPNDMKAPQKIKDLKAQKAAIMKKHGIKEEVEQLEELTSEEKRLMAKMYDKKGNLTPLGKKVMDHGKNESVELDEGTKLKDAINLAKKTFKTRDDRDSKMIGIYKNGDQYIPGELKFRDNLEKDGYQWIGYVDKDGSVSLKRGFKEAVELDERDYKKEYANYHGKKEQIANRASRNQARRIMAKENDVSGMDVGHADNNPLNNDPKNLRIEDPSENRREPRLRKEELELQEDGRKLATKGMGPWGKKDISVGTGIDYYEPKVGNKRQGTITKMSAAGYEVKDDDDGKSYKFKYYDRTKAKGLLGESDELGEASRNLKLINRIKKSGVVKSGSMSKDDAVEVNPKKKTKRGDEAAEMTGESTMWTVYDRILEKRAERYRNAAKADDLKDNDTLPGKGAKDMDKDMAVDKTTAGDMEDESHDSVSKAGRAGPKAKSRDNDNKAGDKKVVNPVKGKM